MVDLSSLPSFCSHEHWGSIGSIGQVAEGYRADLERGATPNRETGLADILLDPYFRSALLAAGDDVDKLARDAGEKDYVGWAQEAPSAAHEGLRPAIERHKLTGTFQCIRRGLMSLYGVDILDSGAGGWRALDRNIYKNYSEVFPWYLTAMRQSGLSTVVRPVHPEYYMRYESDETAQEEASFTHTVLRIDPLLDFWRGDCARRETLAGVIGVEPKDAASWREFIGRLFDLAASRGAVGIKQLQAYSRTLDYGPVSDGEVTWICDDLDREGIRNFQDWVMHECCAQAHERGWPHQVHVGTHNLERSSPMSLRALADRYPKQKLVLLHCWPFVDEAGWLARQLPNVYLDACWLPVLNPEFHRRSLATWLGYVPVSKIMSGHDGTSIEMSVGSAFFTRQVLGEVLAGEMRSLGLGEGDVEYAAASILNDNAVAVYGVGQRHIRS